ncbi:MAG: IPT/TIG domain-containing protein [Candidatus Hydrogenedentota bacterium]
MTALLLCLVSGESLGAPVLVETTTKSAHREPVRGSLHMADLERGISASGPIVLPGKTPGGPLLLTPGGERVITSSGPEWGGGRISPRSLPNFISAHSLVPLRDPPEDRRWAPGGWREEAALLLADPASDAPLLVMLATDARQEGELEGMLRLQPLGGEAAVSFDGAQTDYPLPGPPLKAVSLPDTGRVAVLCGASQGSGALLHIRNVLTGKVVVDALELGAEADEAAGVEPVDLAVSPDQERLYALITGSDMERPGGPSASWLITLDVRNAEPLGGLVKLLGKGESEAGALSPAAATRLYVATRSRQQGFGYVYRLHFAEEAMEIEWEQSYTGVTQPVRMASVPGGYAAAIGVEDGIEIWSEGEPAPVRTSLEWPVNTLAWTETGLYAGTGNRVERLDPSSGEVLASASFQSGHVTALKPLPPDSAAGQYRLAPDSSGDGVPDDWDPEPERESPWLRLPPVIQFQGEAVGQQMRAVLVDPEHGEGSEWRVSFDEEEMPWLRLYPRSGEARGAFYLGVDPADYGWPQEVVTGTIEVEMDGTEPGREAAGSPAEILVQIVPKRSPAPRILWLVENDGDSLRNPADPRNLRGLMDYLAGPPHHFSHVAHKPGATPDLESYPMVVLDARAAARGAVTRQAVLDYVAGGGALLFLGEYLPGEEARVLRNWLTPLGIRIETSERVSGRFSTDRDERLARHWRDFAIENGCGIELESPAAAMVSGASGASRTVFAAAYHGVGHVAALAAATPLESGPMARTENRTFAGALFEWLAASGVLVSDLTGDGLPDHVQDRTADGVVRPGEMDPLDPDTDGDGIPDAYEDRSRTGRVEAGETSPLNTDTDGDGIWDGADPNPLPPADAPYVEQVEPWTAPVEGGRDVLVSGRNFTADSVVWFENTPAPSIRSLGASNLIAEVPPRERDEAGPVDVRVESPALDHEGVLPDGFIYSPRTAVDLTLQVHGRAAEIYEQGEGALRITIDAPTHASVGQMNLLLKSDPPGAVRWGAPSAGMGAEYGRRHVQHRPTPEGGLWIDISEAVRDPAGGVLATVPFQLAGPVEDAGSIELDFARSIVLAPNGAPLDAITGGLTLDFDAPPQEVENAPG